MQAALWAPSMAERDFILEDIAELPDPGRWPHGGRGRRPPSTNSRQNSRFCALRNGTDSVTAAVVSSKHRVAHA